ncbi:stage III sporulation protein AC [Lottiidibacillus patelloidae]|uniref:Stage III sporulation protein AC n=1 Tax=Lottiidibacillus patelloidae TaxID=2670334 RepID=A0A263BV84_9BACI|nr:stage III sporulation protein AC [Lottiidibacillus patelloidae]OZM57634.1 stage III sporulation protein AC [Lottiidibacillus patelloidae]
MDITTVFQIAGLGIVLAMIATVLKAADKNEFVQWITLIGFIFVLFKVATLLEDLFQKIQSVFLFSG